METTLEKALLKKTPCNECRKRKRKCSYEQPCERCKKLNIECSYTVIASPIDLEYMQELEYVKQVEDLEAQICMMEKELNSFKLAQDKNAVEIRSVTEEEEKSSSEEDEAIDNGSPPITTDYPSPVSMDYTSAPSPKLSEFSMNHKMFGRCPGHHKYVPDYMHNEQHHKKKWGKNKHSQLVAKAGNVQVYITPQEEKEVKSWALTVNKDGGMTINTYITSHADLLHHLKDIIYTVDNNTAINQPNPSLQSPNHTYITSAISSFLWKSYGKQRIKNMTKSFQIQYNEEKVVTLVSPIQELIKTTVKIIHAYVNCLHLSQFYLYVPYFLKQYIHSYSLNNVLQSPAVMALCSVIALQPCKHIAEFIPSNAYTDYGCYYFEQARELISEKFDDMSMETMATYAFMAAYKLKLKKYDEGLKYIDMSRRIYSVLQATTQDEVVFLQRMNRCIRFVSDTAFMHEMVARGGPHKYGGRRNFVELLKGNDVIPVMPSDQDSAQEKEFILLIQLKSELQKKLHSVLLNNPISNTLPSCVGEFSHQMEMALRYWYRHDLPDRFQLSLPLFEDAMSDLDFFTTLEKECHGEKLSPKLLCIIYIYNEYLVMARAYVPKNPNQDFPSVDELIARFHDIEAQNKCNDTVPPPRTSLRWEKFLYRVIHFNRFHLPPGTEKNEEKHLRELLTSVQLGDMSFEMPIAQVAIVSALNMVRFTQFLISKSYACFLDYKWLMNAWEMLLRASRFKYEHGAVTLQRIRANMLLCMNIMKQHPIYEKVQGIDEVLDKMKDEFDECI